MQFDIEHISVIGDLEFGLKININEGVSNPMIVTTHFGVLDDRDKRIFVMGFFKIIIRKKHQPDINFA